MKRSEIKTKYLKNSTLENFNKFRKKKTFCRIMLKQILEQTNKHLSQNLCGYRKGFSTQAALWF